MPTVAKALISAAACHEKHLTHHKHVELSTAGIIYLGTPHQGSDNAGLMKTLLDLWSLFAPSTSHVVSDMKSFADFLFLQQQQYRSISNLYPTYYCHETKPILLPSGSRAVIVSKVSAVPPTAAESQRVEMSTDHIGLAKFENVADENFQRLISPVQSIARCSHMHCRERWRKFKGESVGLFSCQYS